MDLESLNFTNRFTNQLPADVKTTNSRRQVQEACFSRVQPTEVQAPSLVAYSSEVADLLGLSAQTCGRQEFADVFGGNVVLPGMDPYAMCYGGHQFGNWAGQLGDGRAINLGEVETATGAHWTLQLKGAGPTPYSRTADGLAVLRSSVREFLCSEAMFHLGVPTTRALSLVLTGEQVTRDMFYDGNPAKEPGAVVCRVAESFVRFGSFQIFSARDDVANLQKLVDFTIRNDFPHLGEPSQETYAAWFQEVCKRTSDMVVGWMRVGFVHGVMNTDNMSILGQTIDYGPYGWIDNFDFDWTPNTTDASGRRYRYGNQPAIAHWNLYQLANALVPIFDSKEPLEQSLEDYADLFSAGHLQMMGQKLGFASINDEDEGLLNGLTAALTCTEVDMTIFFRRLASIDLCRPDLDQVADADLVSGFNDAYYKPEDVSADMVDTTAKWLRQYQQRLAKDGINDLDRRSLMNSVNPKYVLRNYLAQQAIDASTLGDHSLVNQLLDVMKNPYDEQPDSEQFAEKRPEWARTKAGCSMLSCSS
ncbi:MAG: protein adenylyltransferase SelO [Fuerstiella sp.]